MHDHHIDDDWCLATGPRRVDGLDGGVLSMSLAALPSVPFGANLSRLIRSEALCASTMEVARREVVYSCLDGDRSIYLVERGQVKASAPSREGKECLLGIYSAGEVFGELCLVGGARMETVTAMTPAVLRRIAAAKVLSALSEAGPAQGPTPADRVPDHAGGALRHGRYHPVARRPVSQAVPRRRAHLARPGVLPRDQRAPARRLRDPRAPGAPRQAYG